MAAARARLLLAPTGWSFGCPSCLGVPWHVSCALSCVHDQGGVCGGRRGACGVLVAELWPTPGGVASGLACVCMPQKCGQSCVCVRTVLCVCGPPTQAPRARLSSGMRLACVRWLCVAFSFPPLSPLCCVWVARAAQSAVWHAALAAADMLECCCRRALCSLDTSLHRPANRRLRPKGRPTIAFGELGIAWSLRDVRGGC